MTQLLRRRAREPRHRALTTEAKGTEKAVSVCRSRDGNSSAEHFSMSLCLAHSRHEPLAFLFPCSRQYNDDSTHLTRFVNFVDTRARLPPLCLVAPAASPGLPCSRRPCLPVTMNAAPSPPSRRPRERVNKRDEPLARIYSAVATLAVRPQPPARVLTPPVSEREGG